jgi:hypothetical protein
MVCVLVSQWLYVKPVVAFLVAAAALAGATVAASALESDRAAPRLANGFENGTAGRPYAVADWAASGFDVAAGSTPVGVKERSFVDTSTSRGGGRSLRLRYPKGQIEPPDSGMSVPFLLAPQREYFLSYWVRFSKDFSWGTTQFAGKVGLGLTGGASCSGGQVCTGKNGFSSRFIWRRNGQAAIYYYSMDHNDTYGDYSVLKRAGADIRFPTGEWVNLTQRVRINTVTDGRANPNGQIEVYYNGVSAAKITGLRFVNNGDQIDKAFFSSFAGGATAEFAPTRDNYIWYDDIEIATDARDISIFSEYAR